MIRAETSLDRGRRHPRPSSKGVPIFLDHLSETFRVGNTDMPFPHHAIGDRATHHGRDSRCLRRRF
jgi:hypothetical protein